MIKGRSKLRLISGAMMLVVFAVAGFAWFQTIRPHILEIYVFNLPGTPAVFIRTPEDKRILINGGSNSEIIQHLTKILPFYSKHLDLVIAGEANGKTVGGLIDVLNRYLVDEVATISATTLATTTDPIYEIFLKTARDLKIKTEVFHAGDEFFNAKILFPEPPEKFQYSKTSLPQLIVRVEHGSTSFLLTGHATPKIQRFISEKTGPADVLIVFHSLIASNLSKELLASTTPKYTVYSAIEKTKNKKPDSLASVLIENRFNIRETGGIRIISDGKTISIRKI